MKKLLALLAVLSFASYARAADGTDFTQSGEFRVQYQHDINTAFNSSASSGNSDQWFHQRLKWGLNYRVGEKMSAHLTLVDNANWGENPSEIPATVNPGTGTVTGAQAANGQVQYNTNTVNVQEAYGVWQITDNFTLRYGRASGNMADGRVIAANSYEFVANAFDGISLLWDSEMIRAGFFATKGGVAATDNGVADDNTLSAVYGIGADWKTAPDFLKLVHAHYIMVNTDEGDYVGVAGVDPIPQENSSRYGIAIAGDKIGIDYRLDYEGYTGKRKSTAASAANQNISASMIDAEVGYTMASLMGLRVHAKYHTDSGTTGTSTDGTYQGFYYDRHANNGLMGIFSWGNLTEAEIGVSAMPRDDISVMLNYQMYSKTESKDGNYNGTGKLVTGTNGLLLNTVNGTSGNSTSSDLGSEIDLAVNKKYSNNFNITARYGLFTPGSVFKDNLGHSDAQSEYYLETKLTF